MLEQADFFELAPPAGRPHEYPIPAGTALDHCKSCGAEIVWYHTGAGASLPLALATAQQRDGVTYAQSHFLDCPHAKDWSKQR